MALAKSMNDLREKAVDQFTTLEEAAANTGAAIGEKLHHAAENVQDAAVKVRHAANDVAERSVRTVHDVQDTIAQRPLTAALIAAGVGFLIGAVAMRRRG